MLRKSFILALLFIFSSCFEKKKASSSIETYAVPIEDSISNIAYFQDYRSTDTIPKPIWLELKNLPKGHDSIDYDEIDFDKIKFNESKTTFYDKNSLFEKGADEISVINATIPCKGISTVKKKIKNLRFNGIVYSKVDDRVYLKDIDLRMIDISISLDSIKLNNSVTRSFLAKKFPKSFKWRNFGVNWVPSILEPDYKGTFSFLTLRDTNSQNLLRLNFIDNKLFYCNFIYSCM